METQTRSETDAIITEVDGRLLARVEDETMVFEVNCDTVRVTDVTLQFLRDGEKVGSVYNDHGTAKTMAHLDTPGRGDFLGVEVSGEFVADLLAVAAETGRLDESEGSRAAYELRVLDDGPEDEDGGPS